jgi:hypothetical protein
VTLAFAKPAGMPAEAFERGMALLDDALGQLKRLLEDR